MSGWGLSGWFGGGSSAATKKKDSAKAAILQLRENMEMLTKRERHLQTQIDEQDALARKHVATNKAGMCFHFLVLWQNEGKVLRGRKMGKLGSALS